MELSGREKEAYELVCKLNEELYGRFGTDHEAPGFFFVASEYVCAIHWGNICVWDSENDPHYDDDDNEIPIETLVRKSMDEFATAAEWVSRYYARDKIGIDHILYFLNELVKLDPEAMKWVVEKRVNCNIAMADHPTVQVQLLGHDNQDVDQVPEEEREWVVGFLGILNGFFGSFADEPKKGWGQIAAVFESDGRLSGFRRTRDPTIRPGGTEPCDMCEGTGKVCKHCAGPEAKCRQLATCNYTPETCATCQGKGYFPVEKKDVNEAG